LILHLVVRESRHIIEFDEVVFSAPLLFLLYHISRFEYSLSCEKVLVFFTSFYVGFHPTPRPASDAGPELKKEVVLLKFSFRSLLKSNMDQHAVKGQAKPSVPQPLTLRFYPCFDDFSDEKKNLNKQHILSLKIIAFFSCSYISRVPEDY